MRKRRIPKIIVKPRHVGDGDPSMRRIRPIKQRSASKPLIFPNTLKKFYKPHVKKNRVFIIGGGPSLTGVDLKRLTNEDTICVNASINFIDNPTYFITMDYSYFDKRRDNNTVKEVVDKAQYSYFVINSANPYIKTLNGKVTDTRNNYSYSELDKFSGVIYSNLPESPHGFSLDIEQFSNGNNSGYCALQLAIMLGYEEIYLLGFDLGFSKTGKTHFHNKYGQTSNIQQKITEYKDSLVAALKKYNISTKPIKSKIATITDSPLSSSVMPKVSLEKVLSKPAEEKSSLPYIIVSYYTLNTPYEAEANKLKASLNKLKIPHDVVGVKNLGNWQANTRFKAKFMQEMLEKHKGNSIVWVDSDAVIHSYPTLFDNFNYDVGVRWQDFRWRKNECLSGTIYLANNAITRELCKRWEGANLAEGPGATTFEQWNLGSAIEQMREEGKLKDGNLPPEYTMIFDSMRAIYPHVTPVIEHFQASRKLRNKI